MRIGILTIAVLLGCGSAPGLSQQISGPVEHSGMCDASAAVALDGDSFIVANDEDNILRIYSRKLPDPPQEYDLAAFLKPDAGHPEADIEGAAQVGELIYWIASHGRNKDGKFRSSRHRLFATKVTRTNGQIGIAPVGAPYAKLLEDLIASPPLQKFDLKAASQKAPESEGGLNIEGLAATPEGGLLVGFRNPTRDGKALIVSIENPGRILTGERARLGPPIELGLERAGIRSIERDAALGRYLIVAGPYNDRGEFAVHAWSGKPGEEPYRVAAIPADLHPEAMFFFPGERDVSLLSDDGDRKIGNAKCKDIRNSRQQRFRAFSPSFLDKSDGRR